MAFPKLRVPSAGRQMIDTFGGYNHNLRIGDGEFYDMKNLTSDDYPVLSTRGQRGLYTTQGQVAPAGMIAKDALCYCQGTDFFINGSKVERLTLCTACDTCTNALSCVSYASGKTRCPKQLVSMGAYVLIFPDKKYVNTADLSDFGNIEEEFTTTADVTFSLCRQDSTLYTLEYPPSDTAPDNPTDGAMWIDESTSPNVLKQWSKDSGMWMQIATTYVKISSTNIGKAFELYDGIEISGLSEELTTDTNDIIEKGSELAALAGAAVVWDKGDDYIVVVGMLPKNRTITNEITISRKMPKMDFVIESGNRLWGCRYGTATNGEVVNEIYASKLGDFKNWNCYMGISTDSWALPLGSDGPFTGAISHLGHPLFFKENHLHKVYISSTAAHQVVDTPCRGVQQGCAGSLAIVGELLYYKSRSGICAYDGSLPVEISQAFGSERYENAVAGAIGSKYYVSMDDAAGEHHLFVYDAAKGMWHREDNFRADCFCNCCGELYAISDGKICTMLGSGEQDTEPVEWMAQTGMIGISTPDMKYISRLILRLTLPEGSQLRVFAEYDSSGRWEQLFGITGHGTRAFTLPVRPVRCDHMRLRLEGDGPMKLFSITKTIEQGSDVR